MSEVNNSEKLVLVYNYNNFSLHFNYFSFKGLKNAVTLIKIKKKYIILCDHIKNTSWEVTTTSSFLILYMMIGQV